LQEFRWPIRVYYEDVDLAGIVYHANYLKFMERARTEWLRHLGFEQDELRNRHGVIFVVGALTIRFSSAARFNDALTVVSRLRKFRRVTLEFEQRVVGPDEQLMCEAQVKVGCIDARRFVPHRIPKVIHEEFHNAS
jgi:acyl-CoA thioester hydrolase